MDNMELVSEEFKQLHEHLREHEKASSNLTIVMATASATLLSAVGIFYVRLYSENPEGINLAFSYLFLSPSLIVIPLMAAIRGHRESLYKIGLYIKVFYESYESGALWHRRLEDYRKHIKSESHDSVPYFAWIIAIISYAFFAFSLSQLRMIDSWHYFMVLIVLIPLLGLQHYRHNAIKNNSIEDIWKKVKAEEQEKIKNA